MLARGALTVVTAAYNYAFTERQKAILKAGGLLEYTKKEG